MALVKNRILRLVIFIFGWIAVGLGLLGIFVPLLPTTPFILLAAWCFLYSSEKAHAWIYRHPVFGKALNDWETHHAIAPATKFIAIVSILISIGLIWLKVHDEWIKTSVSVFLVGVSFFILTRKSV